MSPGTQTRERGLCAKGILRALPAPELTTYSRSLNQRRRRRQLSVLAPTDAETLGATADETSRCARGVSSTLAGRPGVRCEQDD